MGGQDILSSPPQHPIPSWYIVLERDPLYRPGWPPGHNNPSLPVSSLCILPGGPAESCVLLADPISALRPAELKIAKL